MISCVWAVVRVMWQTVCGVEISRVRNEKGEGTWTWEATSVKAQSVPDSAFKVPAGYTESKGYGGMSTEQQQQMREQMMKQLSPEQRQKIEEMMKQHGGGK